MASSIAAAGAHCCFVNQPSLISSSLCRFELVSWNFFSREPPYAGWNVSPNKLSLFERETGSRCRRLSAAAAGPTKGPSCERDQIVNVFCEQQEPQKKKTSVSGSRLDPGVKGSGNENNNNLFKILAVSEGACIVFAAVSFVHSKRIAHVSSSATGEAPIPPQNFGGLSTWQVLPLWGALLINAILRSSQLASHTPRRKWEELGVKDMQDFTTVQRIGKLEEDAQSVATIVRMLARQLEKLGIRFRVTRRTLREPIQETAILAQKTSEVVSAMALREDMLQSEIHETQRALLTMQQQQAKELDLLVTAMTKIVHAQKALDRKVRMALLKEGEALGSASSRSDPPLASKIKVEQARQGTDQKGATIGSGKWNLLQKLGEFGKVPEKADKAPEKIIRAVGSVKRPGSTVTNPIQNGKSTPLPRSRKAPEIKSRRKTDEMPSKDNLWEENKSKNGKVIGTDDDGFSKEDFWASIPADDLGEEPSSGNELIASSTSKGRLTGASPTHTDADRSSADGIGAFFVARKKYGSSQTPLQLSGNESLTSREEISNAGNDWGDGRRDETNSQVKLTDNGWWSSTGLKGDTHEVLAGIQQMGDSNSSFVQTGLVEADVMKDFFDSYGEFR